MAVFILVLSVREGMFEGKPKRRFRHNSLTDCECEIAADNPPGGSKARTI
jgi:hypothetical protein